MSQRMTCLVLTWWSPSRLLGLPCLLHFLYRYIPLAYQKMPPRSNRSHRLRAEQHVWNLKGSTWQEQISWDTREPCSCLKIWTAHWLLLCYQKADPWSLSTTLISPPNLSKFEIIESLKPLCLITGKRLSKIMGSYLDKIKCDHWK